MIKYIFHVCKLYYKEAVIFCLDFQLEEKKNLLSYLILENTQTADMCDAKLPAEIHEGACNMQVLQSKKEDKVKVNTHYPYVNFVVHLSYCQTDFLFLFQFFFNF